jgi:hypothetical protein
VDGVRGRARGGLGPALFSVALGVGAAVALLKVSRKPAEAPGGEDADEATADDA